MCKDIQLLLLKWFMIFDNLNLGSISFQNMLIDNIELIIFPSKNWRPNYQIKIIISLIKFKSCRYVSLTLCRQDPKITVKQIQ